MRHPRAHVEQAVSELSAMADALGPEMQQYFAYNRERYVALADVMGEVLSLSPAKQHARVLDVGPGFQTLMYRRLWPSLHIDTIGFPDEKFPPAGDEHRAEFDLNDTADSSRWPRLPRTYDVVSYCEVVEHLYTSPTHSLRFLASTLAPGGYMIVTTPNGIALHRRLRLLAGINPQELIREDLTNPGHYREYGREELISLAAHAGLSPVFTRMGHYTSTGSLRSRAFGALTRLLPNDLRKDMAIVFQRTA